MSYFLVGTALLTAGTLLSLLWPLLGGRGRAETGADNDAHLYRQQLSELEQDVARGVIETSESEGARAEIARRLIAVTKRAEPAPTGPAPAGAKGLVAVLTVLGLPILAGAIYLAQGNPGMPGMSFAARGIEPSFAAVERGGMPARPTQAQAEALVRESGNAPELPSVDPEYSALVERLERAVADEGGGDPQGLRLLADSYMRMGRSSEAWRSYDRLIAQRGSEAAAELHSRKAEAMIMAVNGYVSPQAEQAIAAALDKDPAEPVARYYSGMVQAQEGRPAEALAIWEALRQDRSDDAALRRALDVAVAEAKTAVQAGRARAPALNRVQAQALEEMTSEQRQAAIEDMVKSFEQRLTEEGGEPEEWARLMTSYARLGQLEKARRAYELGREAVESQGAASFLLEQALVLGIVGG